MYSLILIAIIHGQLGLWTIDSFFTKGLCEIGGQQVMTRFKEDHFKYICIETGNIKGDF